MFHCVDIDDLKISHKDPGVVTNVNTDLTTAFGKEARITIHHGKVHEYLGITLDYSTPGKVQMKMFNISTNYHKSDQPTWMEL